MEKNLTTNEIFIVLNSIKQSIGLGVSSFIDNGLNRHEAIGNMENHFDNIVDTIKQYYNDKKVKNIIKINIELKYDSDIKFWSNKYSLETFKNELAHKFYISLKDVETKIDYE